ncbi:MAG: T9SS type A sorting domain-containing protein, partial [Ignavibacteria bacterium]|nr:T9SS type A sorting domain-containing protein [Ignavibacteria bacterium]
IGTTVTITGANFSTTAGNNIVFFGAVKGTVTAATSTSLSVTVPTGATYQPITVTVNGLTGYSRLPFIVTFPGGGAITSSSFLPKVDYTTGTGPLSVSIGELDGDGKPDLAVANLSSNTVSVLRNTSTSGTISFASKVDYATGSYPQSVSIGDLDGDGKPDLAVANNLSNTVSVLRNTSTSGSISFASKVDFTTGGGPYSVAVGDVDGDGKPDLAVANRSSSTVSVFRNTSTSGTISFAPKVDYATGSWPASVAIGDVDGDGKPDLAVANWGSSTVSVFRNTSTSGTISFASKVDYVTGSGPESVAVGDIDGDGKPDLAVANYSSSTVSVFRDTSTSGTISFASKVDYATGSNPESVTIGDIDGDGKPDLAVGSWTSHTVSVFRNTSTSGTISFASKVDYATGTNPSSVAIGDLDGDGKPDLAVANVNSHTFSVLRNVIGSAISPTVTTSAASSMTSSSATLNGNVNPNGAATTAYFEWGTSSTLATSTATTSQSVGSGTTPVSVTASLTGLTANTTYYYRVVGQNSAGTQRGSIISFTTRTTTTGITVRVVSPNGGESWNEDMNHGFRWEASDTTGKTIRRIQILLSLNNGATYSVIHDSIPNTGSRGWRVPRSPSDQARVRIVAWNSDGQSASAQSEQAFVIQDVETFVYRTGNVNHTIRNDGFTGSGGSTYDPKEPSLEYPPDSKRHYLYLGQLLFGAVLPSGDTLMTLGYEDNFRPIEPIKITTRADGSETITRFESKKFPGLVVSQYTNAPQGESYIIAMWRFFNTSAGPMNGVILGTFHDMDINDYALNLTGFESANRIGYMFDGKGEWNGYAGVRALSHVPIFRRWGGNVIPEPRIAGQFYQAIFKSTSDDPTGDPPADYRIATLTSPTMLAPGDSITFAYALAIGDGLLGLRNVADRAQQKWNDIAGDIFTVQTGNAANITAKSAELFGYVTPGSTNVQAWFEYGTSATLSTYSSTTPKQVFFSPSAVSFSDGVTNLSTGTRYYFRVAAQRGISIQRGSIATFLTIPGTPTLDSPSNNATGQSTSPTLSWNSTTGATSYRLQVSTSSSFATTTFDDSTLSGTSRQVGPLPSGTLHFWRVNAKNVSGSGDWSFPFQFTTAAAGLTTPTLVSPSNGSSNQPTTLTLSWSTVSGATTYRLQVSTSSGFATTIVDDSTLTTTSRQVGPLANNTTYYWRVSAKGTAATSSFTTAWSFSTLSSVTVATPSPVSFPSNPTSSTDYRLFSMPGTSLLTVGDIVSGSQKIDWKMFRDNGAASNYLVELSSVSPLSTGEGYWLLKKGALTVSRSVSMPPLSSDGTYGISLHSGWNIIGNPFDKNVSWGAVLAANGLLQSVQLIDYFGSYGSTSVLEPFRGYYFDNRTSALSSLKIPYPFGLQKTQTEDRPAVDWRLQLIFESDINRDPENYIGIAASARDGFDELETRKPPLFLDQGFLYFSRPEWDPEYSRFSSDYRPSLGEGQTWDFEVSNPRMTVGKVQIRGMEKIPSDYSVLLVNPFNTEPFDLRANDTYVYRTVSERMAFTLIVGRKEFLDEQLARLLPEEFELVQNFPNPFNASTSISIKLPRDADIRLEVYSLLGQHIRTLAAGTTRAGVHTYVWSGDDHTASIVTSGVYFCRLSVVGSLVKSKSMLFVK